MKRIGLFLLFITIMTTVYTGMNYYVYISLITGLGLGDRWTGLVQILFIILAATFIISRLVQKKYFIYGLTYIGNSWFGIISMALTVFLVKDASLLLVEGKYEKIIFQISLFLIFLLIAWSIYNVIKGTVVKKVTLKSNKFEDTQDLAVVLLSDLHLGLMTSRKWIESVVKQVNNLSPDIIVITGDLVEDEYKHIERFIPILKNFKSKFGVYAVPGNHDHYRGLDNFVKFLKKANINLLMNQGREITRKVNLLGIDEGVAKYNNQLFKDLLTQCKADQFNILLSHQPIYFKEAVDMGVDLQLSGHTHRGQILPLNLIISLFYKYSYGLYQYKTGHIYTTSGTGTWGPPMRLLSECEVVKIIITNKTPGCH